MFSVLARSRALAVSLILFPTLAFSREEAIFASSVTYCEEPRTLLIQRFDLIFFPANESVTFNISAASVEKNVNVTANLLLNVYGMKPVNFTLDLCSVLNGALCPLPTYNFVGADSIRLPSSLGVDGRIPEIAFKIPDLEGFAQLTLTEIGTGQNKACVQATLSNGWSTHQPAVEWVTVVFTLVAFISAIFHSVYPDSQTPFRFLDLFYLYQAIASSAFLNINYPSLYRSFTLNFAWATGLVSTSPSSSLQDAISNMRHHTGGGLPDSSSNAAVGFVNRQLSPFNDDFGSSIASTVSAGLSLLRRSVSMISDLLIVLSRSNLRAVELGSTETPTNPKFKMNLAVEPAAPSGVPLVTATSDNVLDAGIPIYTNSIHISTANAFMTIFLVLLIVLAILGGILALGYAISVAIRRLRVRKGKEAHFDYLAFMEAWLIRLGLIFLLPLLIFTFYQWTLKDSWLSVLLSVITFLGLLVLLIYPSYLILRTVRRSKDPYELYSHSPPTLLIALGPLYAQYRPERYYTFLMLLIVPFLKAIFISFAKPSGLAQVILLFIVEFVVFGLQIASKPHTTKGGNVLSTYLGLTRLIATGLLIAFVQRVAVNPIPRTIIGAILAVIWSVAVIILILDLVIFHVLLPLWQVVTGRFKNGQSNSSSPITSEGSMLEKGDKKSTEHVHHDALPAENRITPASSWDRVTAGRRAHNPTPDQNIPLDPQIIQAYPYPVSPTESVTTGHDSAIPSVYSTESGTITVGSLLPRRWSFSTGIGSLHAGESSPSPVTPAAHSQRSSRPPSSSQYSQRSLSRNSYYSQPSTPSTPADHSEESSAARLHAIREQPSRSSGLEVPRLHPSVQSQMTNP